MKLFEAAREGDINSVQSLLSQGANVNNQDSWVSQYTCTLTYMYMSCSTQVMNKLFHLDN